MIIRKTLKCRACDSKIITRTQVGHKDSQTHSFSCPKCGVRLSYVLDLDQKNAKSSFRQPRNADWLDEGDEEGAIATLMFSDEIPVPISGEGFSPFMATVWNYKDRDEYARTEGLRQQFARVDFDYIDRCVTHFERGNWELFDKESPPESEDKANPYSRLVSLYNAIQGGLSNFTLNSRARVTRVKQRLQYARDKEPRLVMALSDTYVTSGRMLKLWKEIAAVRRLFVETYDALQPLIQMKYWREELQNIADFELSTKRFNELRQLSIDAFETLCRLLVIAGAYEGIILNSAIGVPTTKRVVPIDEFEQFTNATKRDVLARLTIGDLFAPVLDTDLRNGIGHHSAHYEPESDEVVLYDTKSGATVSRTVRYTEFCQSVLDLFAAFELAAMCHHSLHLIAGGRFS